jgi:dipeptidyl aminopeptidase/acylaminoacyl peptidase
MRIHLPRRSTLLGISVLVASPVLKGCGGGGPSTSASASTTTGPNSGTGGIDSTTSPSTVSPSGNYVAMLRSPNVSAARYHDGPRADNIIGLTIVDIADVNNIRDLRSAYSNGLESVRSFSWLNQDEFIYTTLGGKSVTGRATAGAEGDRVLGTIDRQGLKIGDIDVSPDGSQMLVKLFDQDGESQGKWDIYLFRTNGQAIGQMTATSHGFAPLWSPGGDHFMFKDGSAIGCQGDCTGAPGYPSVTCSSHFAPSTSRMLTLPAAGQFDPRRIPCGLNVFWSSQSAPA